MTVSVHPCTGSAGFTLRLLAMAIGVAVAQFSVAAGAAEVASDNGITSAGTITRSFYAPGSAPAVGTGAFLTGGQTTLTMPSVPSANLQPAPTGSQNLGGFNIVVVPDSTLAANAPALAAFNRAAQQWAARISDPITVTVNATLESLPTGVLGSTQNRVFSAGYDTIRNQMVADAAGKPSRAITSSLPTAAQFLATAPSGSSLSGLLLGSKANLKALGFTGLDAANGASDGTIRFSTNFTFDFDNSDGVTPGSTDFETVAAHEIGHLLGFFSFVDEIDSSGPGAISPNTLDLYRFRNLAGSKPTDASSFTITARSFSPNQDQITSDTVDEWRMSTGFNTGDGHQASHWKADDITGTRIGLLDPTLASGVSYGISEADWRAFELIGWDVVVPEPGSACLLMIAGATLILRRCRTSPDA